MFITYRDDSQNSVGLCVPQKNVDEGNDLQSFAQAHAVSEDAAKATAGLVPVQRLDQVIIEKPDSPNLKRKNEAYHTLPASYTLSFT